MLSPLLQMFDMCQNHQPAHLDRHQGRSVSAAQGESSARSPPRPRSQDLYIVCEDLVEKQGGPLSRKGQSADCYSD